MGATYVECSSKEMRGVDQVFELAVNTVIEAEEERFQNNDGQAMTITGGGGGAAKKMTGKKIRKRTCKIL
jgi:Ras homolog gene family, member A